MAGITRGNLRGALDHARIPKPKASGVAMVRKADGTPRIEGDANKLDPKIKAQLSPEERKQHGIPY